MKKVYVGTLNEVFNVNGPDYMFYEDVGKLAWGGKVAPWNKGKKQPELLGNQHAKGHKPTEEENERRRQKNLKKVYSMVDPNGKEIIFNNLRQFCEKQNLSRYYLRKFVATGEWKQYKGWTNFKVIEELSPSPADC